MARRAAFVFSSSAALILALWVSFARAGNTTCISGQMDWYSSVVGESPCVTYQRLRQICNNDYQVPIFANIPPGDRCSDQVSACCCNTIAFQLSMLCMNCQYDPVDGDLAGFDAPTGTYTEYQNGCGAGTNNSLPNDIQAAVCNENIRLDDFLYGGWSDGSWFYVWTKENAERDHAANNNNTFTYCPNQISPSSTPTPTSNNVGGSEATVTGTSQPSAINSSGSAAQTSPGLTGDQGNKGSHAQTGVLVGGVVGGAGVLAIFAASFVFWRRRRDGTARTSAPQIIRPYSYAPHSGQNSPAVSSTGLFAPMMASKGTSSPPRSPGPWTQSESSYAPPSTFLSGELAFEFESLHNEGGNVVAGIIRSSRPKQLLPVYEQTEMRTGASDSQPRSVSAWGGSEVL